MFFAKKWGGAQKKPETAVRLPACGWVLFQREGDLLGGDGDFPVPDPGGPVDGMGQGGGGGVDDDFADGLGAEGAGGLVAVLKLHPQMAHVQAGRDLVLQEGGADGPAVVVVLDILHQGVADALDDAALGLNPGQGRVDGDAAVHHRHIVQDGDKAGFLVQLDLHHAYHVGRG